MQFDVVKTNIINIVADAIVLPANENLKEGSGTSKLSLKQLAERHSQKHVIKSVIVIQAMQFQP